MDRGAWWAAVHGVAKSQTRLYDFTFTFHFHALEKEVATHSNVLAWRIPGTGEPGGLPSMGLHRVGHDWSDLAAACSHLLSALCVVGEKIIRSRKRGEPRSAWITNTIMRHHYPPLPSGESSQPKAPMYADWKKDKGKYILLNKHLD